MSLHVCVACGAWFPDSPAPPARCPICEDARQYVPPEGQRWTTPAELAASGREIVPREEEPGLWSVEARPGFAIGQRALLVRTPEGNLLWDCLGLISEGGVSEIQKLGGVRAIAVSHPHFHGAMSEWSRAFGGVPIHLHAADREWLTLPDPAVQHWEGEALDLFGGLRLVRVGGHFEGSACLLWPEGAEGRGVLLSGDTPHVLNDGKSLAFMWSYPNAIPLPAREVRRIAGVLAPLEFDRVYGAWPGKTIREGAKEALARSAETRASAVE